MLDLPLLLTPADVELLLAGRLRDARRARGWTQEELGARSGLGVATVARLERSGQGQLRSFVHLCAALGRLDCMDVVPRRSCRSFMPPRRPPRRDAADAHPAFS